MSMVLTGEVSVSFTSCSTCKLGRADSHGGNVVSSTVEDGLPQVVLSDALPTVSPEAAFSPGCLNHSVPSLEISSYIAFTTIFYPRVYKIESNCFLHAAIRLG